MCMVPVISLVTVVTAKVKFSLFPYSGNIGCSGNGVVTANAGFSVYGYPVFRVTAILGFSEYCYSRYTGSRGNKVKVGYSVHGSSDSTGCSGNGQSKFQSVCLQW